VKRLLEPELMDDPAQACAYAEADFESVNAAFVERFRCSFPELARGRIADLGCGPADIPERLTRMLPAAEVIGIDAARAMLRIGRRRNVAAALVCARVPALPFRERSFDAIVSNSLLHHLPEPRMLWTEIARLARSGAAILVVDLARPASAGEARELVEQYAGSEPPILKRDFYNSLRAALTVDEVRESLPEALRQLDCRTVSDRHLAVSGRGS
jgi:ubiquinone/menaquinone biosynthesis C-methylase UbiE